MNIKSQLSNVIKKKLFNTFIINEEVFSQMAEKEQLSENQEKYGYDTNIENVQQSMAVQTYKKELAIKRILDNDIYSFKNALLILNPYKISLLTAVLLFNTEMQCMVRYVIKGIRGSKDYTVCDETYTTRHRVPILGLYGGRNNKIDLSLVDKNGETIKHRVIQIYVSPIQENIRNMVSETDTKMSQFGFIMLNTAIGSPVAIDRNGDVRYSIQIKTGKLGMIPLANGHFLLVDKTANRIDKYGRVTPCRYHEMDYMGRVYRTYLLEYRIGRAITQHGDSLFFVTASDDGHLSDRIAELNLKTGELIKYCDIHSIVGDKYRVYDNWIDTSNIEYNDGRILITAKRLNSIISIDWKELKPDWIIAPPKVWQDSDVSKYVLKDKSEHREGEAVIPVCSFPEYTSLMEDNGDKKKIVLFDIRNVVKYDGKVIVPGGKRSTKNSMVKIIDIDEKDMSYRVSEQTEVLSSLRFSRVIHSEDEKYPLVAQGYLR